MKDRVSLEPLAWVLLGALGMLGFVCALQVLPPSSAVVCFFDGTAFWSMTGSLAIIATAIYAARQFGAFLDTERVKNTLATIERYRRDILPDLALMTKATFDIAHRELNEDIQDYHVRALQEVNASGDNTTADLALFTKVVDASGFIFDTLSLYKRGQFDPELFARSLGVRLMGVMSAFGPLYTAIFPETENATDELREIVQRAMAAQGIPYE